jgi:hypothetical protein
LIGDDLKKVLNYEPRIIRRGSYILPVTSSMGMTKRRNFTRQSRFPFWEDAEQFILLKVKGFFAKGLSTTVVLTLSVFCETTHNSTCTLLATEQYCTCHGYI